MREENRTRKSCDSKDSKKPVLLKNRGHSRCLEVRLGNLGLELWDFPNDEAKPYARLIFEPDQIKGWDATDQPERNADHASVDLDVIQAGTISAAVEQWLLSFESNSKDESSPSLHMQLASLSLNLYPEANGQGPKAEFGVRTEEGVEGQAALTRRKGQWKLFRLQTVSRPTNGGRLTTIDSGHN